MRTEVCWISSRKSRKCVDSSLSSSLAHPLRRAGHRYPPLRLPAFSGEQDASRRGKYRRVRPRSDRPRFRPSFDALFLLLPVRNQHRRAPVGHFQHVLLRLNYRDHVSHLHSSRRGEEALSQPRPDLPSSPPRQQIRRFTGRSVSLSVLLHQRRPGRRPRRRCGDAEKGQKDDVPARQVRKGEQRGQNGGAPLAPSESDYGLQRLMN